MRLKKIILLMIAIQFSVIMIFAQAVPVSTKIENENRSAVMIEINQPLDITTDALQQKLMRAGLKEKVRNGSASYKGVILSEISKDRIDLYTKVEAGPNNTSVVYMAVSKGYNNFTYSGADTMIIGNVQAFLNSFIKDADNHFADVDINNQMKMQNKSEKEYRKLLDEQSDLENKKTKINSRLTEIQNELAVRKVDMEKMKVGVEESKTKRSNNNNQ